MRLITWAIRFALFVVLLAFAAKNTDPVTLRFYFDLAWQAPLVALLLAFFAAGAVLGLIAMSGTYLAQRKEIARLQRSIGVSMIYVSHDLSVVGSIADRIAVMYDGSVVSVKNASEWTERTLGASMTGIYRQSA